MGLAGGEGQTLRRAAEISMVAGGWGRRARGGAAEVSTGGVALAGRRTGIHAMSVSSCTRPRTT